MKKFALISKTNPPRIVAWDYDLESLNNKITALYWNLRGASSQGSNYSMADLYEKYDKVIIEIKGISNEGT